MQIKTKMVLNSITPINTALQENNKEYNYIQTFSRHNINRILTDYK